MIEKIEYYLTPESGYVGEYERKEAHYMIKHGTIADMIHDSTMLWNDYNKVIPNFYELNRILNLGYYNRLVEWDPITITKEEYYEIVNELLNMEISNPYTQE